MYTIAAYPDAQNLEVTEIMLVKQTHELCHHEYLVASVKGAQERTYYLKIERYQERDSTSLRSDVAAATSAVPQGQDSALGILEHGGNFISFLSQRSSSDSNNDDMVEIGGSKLKTKSDIELAKITCEGLYLHHLVIIAQMVHDSDLSYSLFAGNCFWFAGAILAVVEKFTGSQVEILVPKSNRIVLLNLFGKRSKAGGMKLFKKPSEEKLEEPMTHFKRYQDLFWNRVLIQRDPLDPSGAEIMDRGLVIAARDKKLTEMDKQLAEKVVKLAEGVVKLAEIDEKSTQRDAELAKVIIAKKDAVLVEIARACAKAKADLLAKLLEALPDHKEKNPPMLLTT